MAESVYGLLSYIGNGFLPLDAPLGPEKRAGAQGLAGCGKCAYTAQELVTVL